MFQAEPAITVEPFTRFRGAIGAIEIASGKLAGGFSRRRVQISRRVRVKVSGKSLCRA
jgi:hypothetical protein